MCVCFNIHDYSKTNTIGNKLLQLVILSYVVGLSHWSIMVKVSKILDGLYVENFSE